MRAMEINYVAVVAKAFQIDGIRPRRRYIIGFYSAFHFQADALMDLLDEVEARPQNLFLPDQFGQHTQ